MMKRALLIVNPISGTRRKDGLAPRLANALEAGHTHLETATTTAAGDAARLAADAAADGADCVIVAGGDGTVNEAASSLCGSDTALGIIPCGSGNGLARTLGIPQNFQRAIDIIAAGNRLRCDHGLVNRIPFFCTFGVGFDAAVTRKFACTKRRGKMSYIRSALLEFIRYTPQVYALEINGAVITRRAFIVAVCNTPQYGNNAYIAPGASINDGLLDVTVVHSGSTLSTAIAGIDMLTGYLDRNTLIETFRVPRTTITRLEPGAAQVDGESHTLGKRLDVECRPASIDILCPAEIPPFKPIISPLFSMLDDARNDINTIIHGDFAL